MATSSTPDTIQTPTDVAENYLLELQSLKPTVNTAQTDNDWWIRSRVVGGVIAGVYADQRLIANDVFPQNARHDALANWLQTLFGNLGVQGGFLPATQANGFMGVTGTTGQIIAQGIQSVYIPNGNVYQSTSAVELDLLAGTGLIPMQSVAAGQSQNLQPGAQLQISSPPAGLNPVGLAGSGGFADATDAESDSAARARILQRLQEGLSVGRVSDYIQYAEESDPSVTSASVVRFPFGLGTVGVYITSGTTNIDEAINNGEAITIIPSQHLIDIVQANLNINSPITDCVTVFAPTPLPINVSVRVVYAQGDGSTILSGQTLTQDQLVAREVMRALYKTPVGGFQLNASGFVVASYIEETIDVMLSNESVIAGSIPILLDRQVAPLSVSGNNLGILPSQAPIPGVINISQLG